MSPPHDKSDQRRGEVGLFREAWQIYGGWKALLSSPYFYGAVLLTAACRSLWSQPEWWNISYALLPSLIGFLIAAFALILATGDDRFKRIVANTSKNDPHSALDDLAASFLHFIVIQIFALVFALIANASSSRDHFDTFSTMLGAFGFFLLAYSIACGLSAVLKIFLLARHFTISQPKA